MNVFSTNGFDFPEFFAATSHDSIIFFNSIHNKFSIQNFETANSKVLSLLGAMGNKIESKLVTPRKTIDVIQNGTLRIAEQDGIGKVIIAHPLESLNPLGYEGKECPVSIYQLIKLLPLFLSVFRKAESIHTLPLREIRQHLARLSKKSDVKQKSFRPIDELSRNMKIFGILRPFYYKSYLCRLDCIALLLFLQSNGFDANLLVGVNTEPFLSHCWLQLGSVVLNDDFDFIRTFTPIYSLYESS